MADVQQFGLEEWDLARYESFVHDNVEILRDTYRRRARKNRLWFRGAGILVILLSAILPLLAGFDFDHKDWTLGIIGVVIAVTTALRSFFQWDQLWSLLRQTDFELTELIARWRLAIAGANAADVKSLTEQLLQAAAEVRGRESKGYFATLRFPDNKKDS